MKNIKYNNYYIIFGLIVLFLVVLNYNNLTNFFKIKEGKEGKEEGEEEEERKKKIQVIRVKILEHKENMFTDTELGSSEEKSLEEFLSNAELRGKIKRLLKLYIKLIMIQNNHDNYREFKKEIEKRKLTYSNFKAQVLGDLNFIYMLIFGLSIKSFKDNGIDLFSELESLENDIVN